MLEAGDHLDPDIDGEHVAQRLRRTLRRATRRQEIQRHCYAWNEVNPDVFVDDVDNPYVAADGKPYYWFRCRGVGGRTLASNGVALRLSDWELKAGHRDGLSEEWPLSYAELSPFYARVERFLGVHGSTERLSQLPDGMFIAPRELRTGELVFQERLHARYADRRVIPCRYFARTSSFPGGCSVSSTLAAALKTGRVTLQTNSVTSHVLVDPHTGRATGVAYVDTQTGTWREIHARVVALCASTLESTRILLNSTSNRHPGGLGNSSGVLGKFLMDKIGTTALAIVPGVYSDAGTQNAYDSFLIPNFTNLERSSGKFGRGYGLMGGMQPLQPSRMMKLLERMRLLRIADESNVFFWLQAYGETLPRAENFVELDPQRKDRWGIPILRISCAWSQNELAMFADMQQSMREMFEAVGGTIESERETPTTPGAKIHEVGTARMGIDPRTSVLNRFNQCWDAPNVFVLDGACWVSSGWQPTSLTIMALAVRGAEHIVSELKRMSL